MSSEAQQTSAKSEHAVDLFLLSCISSKLDSPARARVRAICYTRSLFTTLVCRGTLLNALNSAMIVSPSWGPLLLYNHSVVYTFSPFVFFLIIIIIFGCTNDSCLGFCLPKKSNMQLPSSQLIMRIFFQFFFSLLFIYLFF